MKIDYLSKVRNDAQANEQTLKKQVEIKQHAYEEANRELRNIKSEYDRQSSNLEHTLNEQLQNKT